MNHSPARFSIRPAGPADIPALVDLYRESAAFHRALDKETYRIPDSRAVGEQFARTLASADGALFVAVIDGQVAGYSQVRLLPPPNAASMIRPVQGADVGLAVRAPYRRQGLGSALLEAAHRWARERQAGLIQLDCHARNEAALHLYQKLGYRITGHFLTRRLPGRDA